MRPIVIFAALLVVACDTPPVEGPPGPAGPAGPRGAVGPAGPPGGSTVKSGTRLKARVARSEDGASQFLGWWDSEFQMRCERGRPAHDLEFRCLPETWNADASGLFADAACSVRAVRFNADRPFCVFGVSNADGARSAYHPFGAAVDRPYKIEGGDCAEAEWPDGWEDLDWRGCGDLPELPLESFAEMPELLED